VKTLPLCSSRRFLVEQRIDLAQGLAGMLAVVGADEGKAGGGQGPEALETVVLRGSGRGAQEDRRQKKHEPPALAIHRAMLQQSRENRCRSPCSTAISCGARVAVRARRHAFTFFLVLDRIYNLTELVIAKGCRSTSSCNSWCSCCPRSWPTPLPMALLVAVLLAGGRLAGDLEIVAFKAAGVSLLRLFRPALLAGIAVTAATGLLTLVLNPLANKEFNPSSSRSSAHAR